MSMQFKISSLLIAVISAGILVLPSNVSAMNQDIVAAPTSQDFNATGEIDLSSDYNTLNRGKYLLAQARPGGRNGKRGGGGGDQIYLTPDYKFEFRATYWLTGLNSTVRSDEGDLQGTEIDLAKDLGIDSENGIVSFDFTWRIHPQHKLKLSYVAISYTSDARLTESIAFSGEVYPVDSQVGTDIDYNSTKLTYELDFIANDKGYFGAQIAANNMKADSTLVTNNTLSNSASAQITLPMFGLIGKQWFTPWVSAGFAFNWIGHQNSSLFDAMAHLDFFPTTRIGLTVGIRKIVVNIDEENTVVDLDWSGVFAGFVLRI